MESPVVHVPITVDIDNVQSGVVEIIKQIKPDWSSDQIKFKVFTEGITNKLVGAYVRDVEEMVLTRVYGENTELFIDRAVEQKTMQFLHKHGCAKPLYCSFENGICYGFINGQVFDDIMMKDKKYGVLVAKEMAKLHTLSVPESYAPGQTRSSYFLQFDTLLKLMPKEFADPAKNKRYQEEVMSVAELKAAADELEKIATDWHESLVLCHHDLLIKNLVYNEKEERVYFIDYEYAGLSYAALDIGDHFDEYAGVEDMDFRHYPAREHQLFFIRAYLNELHKLRGENEHVTDDEVETWYKRVNKMALMAHLFWGVWGIVQAYNSSIYFDFMGFGIQKMNEYKRLRPTFLAL